MALYSLIALMTTHSLMMSVLLLLLTAHNDNVCCWLQLIDGCISACYQPASTLAAVAAELTSSRGLRLSATECAELLRRHCEHITDVLEELSVTQWKPSLNDLLSLDVVDSCGFSLLLVISASFLLFAVTDFLNEAEFK